ncbi:hypothetical protein GYMLUDRAFT_249871 [Collybiopsis luxurians FD-317 M1]|uniref:Uncharacterized protein n=1 Tax=Collybiopsis luxurians FD-317 M1 TaxID=944289 RepID=A0A0D0CGD2_9AGAR|nr:hypothetical protein GYMLUDRAFT_249871 [Collybiopsis luxurians FD-317 M1]
MAGLSLTCNLRCVFPRVPSTVVPSRFLYVVGDSGTRSTLSASVATSSASMVSIDEVSKVLIWSPDPATGGEIQPLHHTPRVIRIADKLNFAQISTGCSGSQEGASSTTTVETRRSGYECCEILKYPGYLYIGHEEGHISIRSLEGDDGGLHPKCFEVMKVASTDVASMEGIHDKLWVGGKNRLITVYDVAPRSWIVMNSRIAHPVLPVLVVMMSHLSHRSSTITSINGP